MKRTVKHHKSKKKHSREGAVSHRRSTVYERKANKYGPVKYLLEESVEEPEEERALGGQQG